MFNVAIKATNTERVTEHLSTTEARVMLAMRTGLTRALQFAVGIAGTTYMSGPTKAMLGVRTGRLRGALASEVAGDDNQILGRIGNNLPYAAFWEFGFKGAMNVRAHTRVSGWVGANGESLKSTQPVFEGLGFGRTRGGKLMPIQGPTRKLYDKDIRPASVRMGLSNFKSLAQVRAHRRTINQPARPYLAPALDAVNIPGEIRKELKKVANE
ncbi:MAG: hypothetical protein H7Y43_04405 [Akkermansiaceae bacterium]|nr:hypothetical protein [Verrucomicrobiales bacterium]